MKKIRVFLFLSILFMIAAGSDGQTNKPVKDYFTVPGPVVFDAVSYSLSWSSHPSPTFYKQEYIVKGDNPDRYGTMIMLDAVTGNTAIKDVVAAKLAELKTAKQTNPFISYETVAGTKAGEYVIDFIMTANDANGKISIAERNVYRYTSFTTSAGKKGILLFGVSVRSYGNDAEKFIATSKTNKLTLENKVLQFKMPVIKLVQ